jgi:hypothetical protein
MPRVHCHPQPRTWLSGWSSMSTRAQMNVATCYCLATCSLYVRISIYSCPQATQYTKDISFLVFITSTSEIIVVNVLIV